MNKIEAEEHAEIWRKIRDQMTERARDGANAMHKATLWSLADLSGQAVAAYNRAAEDADD